MAYRRERRIYILEFADPEYEGLEIKVRSIPIRELTELMVLDPESEDPAVRVSSINKLMAAFAEALVSWNMTDENGAPLPATLEYIESEETDFVLTCIAQWMAVISRVNDASPLDGNSTPGPAIQEAPSPVS
jgi:hypothetical protein